MEERSPAVNTQKAKAAVDTFTHTKDICPQGKALTFC